MTSHDWIRSGDLMSCSGDQLARVTDAGANFILVKVAGAVCLNRGLGPKATHGVGGALLGELLELGFVFGR